MSKKAAKEKKAVAEEPINEEELDGQRSLSQEAFDEALKDVGKLNTELSESKDKYLRLYSEFENYRRRTSKEKLDMISTANESLMTALLPILDDFQRATKAFESEEDLAAIREGVDLIHQKLVNTLQMKGLKEMKEVIGNPFDAELQEAITKIPAPEEALKDKVVDVVENGYYLGEKVIRFAKVVIGS
jgi:molecular chaperone GrpE